jgi:hypothetical protein
MLFNFLQERINKIADVLTETLYNEIVAKKY